MPPEPELSCSFFAQNHYNDSMGENSFFISYSRRQLYFAEALSLELQKSGLSVWMDLQRLEPGIDWQSQIDKGLRDCTSLILVASKQSLSSSYVESEWRTALDAGKPVIIVYYEEVDQPVELQSSSLVDFRGPFARGVKVLVDVLENGSPFRDVVSPPNRLGLPRRLPPAILLVAALLVVETLASPLILPYAQSFLLLPSASLINGLVVSVACLWLVWQFLHHRFVIHAASLAFILPLIFYMFPQMSRNDDLAFFFAFPQMIVLMIAFYWLVYVRLGPELLRWSAPAGAEDQGQMQRLRRTFNKRATDKTKQDPAALRAVLDARASGTQNTSTVVLSTSMAAVHSERKRIDTYSLHYAAADEPIAKTVRSVFSGNSIREVESDGQAQVVILTENLPRSQLKQLLDSKGDLVLILGGNVLFQGDPLLGQAAGIQLIDYREHSAAILRALARTLRDAQEEYVAVSLETTPASLSNARFPSGVRPLGAIVFSIGAWLILSGFVSLTQPFLGTTPLSLFGLAVNLVGVICGLFWIKLGSSFWQRRAVRSRFLPVLLICTFLGINAYFGGFFMLGSAKSAHDLYDWTLTLSALFTNPYLYCFVLPMASFSSFVTLIWWIRLGDWLPSSSSRPEPGDRFESLPVIRQSWIWGSWIAGAFLAFGLRGGMYAAFRLLPLMSRLH
jgi:TIR domain-containing protein